MTPGEIFAEHTEAGFTFAMNGHVRDVGDKGMV